MNIPMRPSTIRAGLLALALAAPGPALAADDGAIDGIYRCDITLEGKALQAYLSLNGKKDGKTIYMVAADTEARDGFSGYGLGLISGSKFSGNTSFNKRFDFAIGFTDSDGKGYQGVTLKGAVGVTGAAGKPVNAYLQCKSIW